MNIQNTKEATDNQISSETEVNSATSAARVGRGWHGNSEGHANAGSKGGQKVSQNSEHMARIGKKGGQAVSQNREHMSQIGRKGGKARGSGSHSAEGANKP